MTTKRSFLIKMLGAFALVLTMQALAADKVDPSGTWTWTTPGRNGGPERKLTLKLKTEGEKVTGKLTSPGRDGAINETEIVDAKLDGDTLTFTVTRENNGNKMVQKYNAKVAADTLKGKVEFERNGEPQSREFEAKREAAEAKKDK